VGCLVIGMASFSSGLQLNDCEQAIYNCCDDQTHSPLSLRCFELNRCAGLYWSRKICSQKYIDRVRQKVWKEAEDRNEIPDDEVIEVIEVIDDGVNDIPRTPIQNPRKPPKRKQQKPSFAPVIRARPDIQCSNAIVSCCDENSRKIPFRCFEREGCPGIYWSFRRPRKICSTYIIDKAYETLANQIEFDLPK